MPASLDEWSDQHWDRAYARQIAQIDNMKLLATFTIGVASTLVATALQVLPQSGLDVSASIVLGIALLLTVGVLLLDRLKWPSRRKVLEKQRDESWSDAELMKYLTMLSRDTEEENELVVRRARLAVQYQVAGSAVAAVLAVISLFQPGT